MSESEVTIKTGKEANQCNEPLKESEIKNRSTTHLFLHYRFYYKNLGVKKGDEYTRAYKYINLIETELGKRHQILDALYGLFKFMGR